MSFRKGQRWTPEMLQYITDNCDRQSNIRIAEAISTMCEYHFTADDISAAMKRHDIRRTCSGKTLRNQEIARTEVTAEIEDFIRQNHVGTGARSMGLLIKEKFGVDHTKTYWMAYYHKHGYSSGLTGRYGDERKPDPRYQFQKGVRQSVKTEYQKGHKPENWLPVGSKRKRGEQWFVKTAEPHKWELLNRVVWRQANGPIPKGMMVSYMDGNPDNCELSNLELITMSENNILNHKKYRSGNPEATKLGLMSVRLENRIKELKK